MYFEVTRNGTPEAATECYFDDVQSFLSAAIVKLRAILM